MAYWWVNHKQTRTHEVRGHYLWSPMRNANGARNVSYDNMAKARPGDWVFSFADGRIGAVGRVVQAAAVSPKPTEFKAVGSYWSHEGWLVEVDFVEVPSSIRPRDHIAMIGPMLPGKYSPIKPDGNGNQGIYLAAISDALGMTLRALLRVDEIRDMDSSIAYPIERAPDLEVLDDIHDIESDESIPETQRIQLSKARIGQGLFRKRVVLLDAVCRVTGVSDERVLVASHIKPWRSANNAERLDGHNGMLLSPHVDALFDQHLITFEDDGRMRSHPGLSMDVLDRWALHKDIRVERFRSEQHEYLAHHRAAFAARAHR